MMEEIAENALQDATGRRSEMDTATKPVKPLTATQMNWTAAIVLLKRGQTTKSAHQVARGPWLEIKLVKMNVKDLTVARQTTMVVIALQHSPRYVHRVASQA